MTAARASPASRFAKMWNEDVVAEQQRGLLYRRLYINTGLEAQLGAYKLEGYYTHSVAKLDSTSNGAMDNGHFWAGLDAVVNPASTADRLQRDADQSRPLPGLRARSTSSARRRTRMRFPISGSPRHFWGKNTMDDVAASVVGAPFSTWAGPVNTGAFGEWRRLGYSLFNDAPAGRRRPAALHWACASTASPGTSTRYSNSGSPAHAGPHGCHRGRAGSGGAPAQGPVRPVG